ncbi:MAG: efflux RND transporter periplasmic adaptor subunit [bacterium]
MKSVLWMIALPALLGASCTFKTDKPDGSGTIECTQVRVAAEVTGRITSLLIGEGDSVTNGQIVARLDPVPYQLRCDETRAALAQTQAQRDLMLAGSRDEDIQRARAQVREAKAMADAAAADAHRIEAIFSQNSATQKQRDDAVAAAERTAASLAAAEQQLSRLVKGNRQEEIRISQAAVELAQARLAQMEKNLADCTVKAAASGIITTKTVEQGEMVMAGAPLATLSQLDEAWLSLYLPETRLAGVKLGQKARVKVDGDPMLYEGAVTFISPEAEFTPRNVQTPDERTKLVYRIKITLPNTKRTFKPGMPADGYL